MASSATQDPSKLPEIRTLFRVTNLVAVITGGGTGIGKMAAHAFAANGAKAVYILGRRLEVLERCRNSSSRPDVIFPVVCDVTSKESLEAAAELVRKTTGYCNFVFANSGVAEMPVMMNTSSSIIDIQKALWSRDMDACQSIFLVNTIGAFYTTIAFLDLLEQGNRLGGIPQKSQAVFTSSIGGYTRQSMGVLTYSASKAAMNHIAKQLAGVLAPHKIRVNVIVPGLFPSEATDGSLNAKFNCDFTQEGGIDKGFIPLQRAGRAQDIMGLLLFLASEAGGFLCGAELVTDGGTLAIPPPLVLPNLSIT